MWIGQGKGGFVRLKKMPWMRRKGHHGELCSMFEGKLFGLSNQDLMTAVNAVKIADGNDTSLIRILYIRIIRIFLYHGF